MSLKRLFIAFTVLTVVFYLAYIRPTQVAENFVAEVKRGDFQTLESLSVGGEFFKDRVSLELPGLPALDQADISGGLGLHHWQDIFKIQRHAYVEFGYPPTDQLKPGEYQRCVNVIVRARLLGVEERAWNSLTQKK